MCRLFGIHRRVAKGKTAMAARKLLAFSNLLVLLAVLPQILGASTVTLTTSGSPSVFGASVTLTATVSPAGGAAKVTFYDGVTVLGTAPVVAGSAVLHTILLPAGSRKLTAFYLGDGVNAPVGTAAPTIQVVNAAAATHLAPPNVLLPQVGAPRLAAAADFDND